MGEQYKEGERPEDMYYVLGDGPKVEAAWRSFFEQVAKNSDEFVQFDKFEMCGNEICDMLLTSNKKHVKGVTQVNAHKMDANEEAKFMVFTIDKTTGKYTRQTYEIRRGIDNRKLFQYTETTINQETNFVEERKLHKRDHKMDLNVNFYILKKAHYIDKNTPKV